MRIIKHNKRQPLRVNGSLTIDHRHLYVKFIKKFQNLIVLRTFSKSYGLAGLRAGYLISNKLIKVYQPDRFSSNQKNSEALTHGAVDVK